MNFIKLNINDSLEKVVQSLTFQFFFFIIIIIINDKTYSDQSIQKRPLSRKCHRQILLLFHVNMEFSRYTTVGFDFNGLRSHSISAKMECYRSNGLGTLPFWLNLNDKIEILTFWP